MRIAAFIAFVLAAALLPLAANAAPKSGSPGVAVFCEGTYALCIKAPCAPVLNVDGSVTKAVCVWSSRAFRWGPLRVPRASRGSTAAPRT